MAEMTAQEAAEWGKTLDFTTVWAALTKMGERVDKMAEKVDWTTENVNKLAEQVDRVTKNVGGLNHSIGDLVETDISSCSCL
jgi:methyl-accepting chemotaxis protein